MHEARSTTCRCWSLATRGFSRKRDSDVDIIKDAGLGQRDSDTASGEDIRRTMEAL